MESAVKAQAGMGGSVRYGCRRKGGPARWMMPIPPRKWSCLLFHKPARISDKTSQTRSREMRFCRPYACILTCLIPALQPSGPVWAQAGSADALSGLRGKSSLTPEELATLDGYLDQGISELASEEDLARAGRRFRDQVTRHYNHSANSPSFKQHFAQRCASRFADQIRSNPGPLELPLLRALSALADPETVPTLKEAAKSANAAARAVAVRAVSGMSAKIESDPAKLSEVIQWLEQIGKSERDGSVLSRVYRALNFTSKRNEQAASLTNILEARLDNYKNNTVSGGWAELDGLTSASRLASDIGDPDKRRLVGILAQYLVYYTHRYIYEDLSPSSRGDLHRLILMAERAIAALAGIASDNTSVARAIASGASDRYDQIRLALASWVGSPDSAGRLNAAPWQVPTGAVNGLDFSAEVPSHPDDPLPISSGSP